MGNKSKKWYLFVETALPHCTVDFVRGSSIDDAIENYCLSNYIPIKKFKNGRWRWGNEYYNSAKDLIASNIDISLEITDFEIDNNKTYIKAFCSIDWFELMLNWEDFYMYPKKKIGKCYEWYSPKFEYYAIFRDPDHLLKRFKDGFPIKEILRKNN